MIKRIGMFTRRVGLERSAFSSHWMFNHRRLVMALPGMLRYVQNHPVDPIGIALPSSRRIALDGLAEMWWPDADAMARTFADHRSREALHEDEICFMATITVAMVEDTGLAACDGTAKLTLLMRTVPGQAEAAADWRAALLASLPNLKQWRGSRILETWERERIPPLEVVPDYLLELRFDTLSAAVAALETPTVRDLLSGAGDHASGFGCFLMAEHKII